MKTFSYFRSNANNFSINNKLKKIYVLNNNSCDMDSFICSFMLAICRNLKEKIFYLETASQDEGDTNAEILSNSKLSFNQEADKIYLPLMNCKRGELKTRLDINYVMNIFSIDENEFYYINDEEVIYDLNNSSADLILVDHNTLDPSQTYFSDLVIEIFDHHSDNNSLKNNSYKNLKQKSLKFPLGSCSTLILLDYYLSDNFLKKILLKIFNPLFLISAILLDTDNFKKDLYLVRWIDLDYYVCKKIVNEIIPEEGKNKWGHVQEYYKNLSNAKFDETANLSLGVDSLMNKDKKSFKWGNINCDWSSLQVGLKSITNMYGWICVISYFESCRSSKENIPLSLYITLSGYSGKINGLKILLIYDYLNKIVFSDLQNFLINELGVNFKNLKYKKEYHQKIIKVYMEKTYSRKLLEPILCKYFLKLD